MDKDMFYVIIQILWTTERVNKFDIVEVIIFNAFCKPKKVLILYNWKIVLL